ncbi:MAG: hypothetical protein J1E98_09070 [Lachnospiraceae bacterium]|nr:hypothetical protein [Lachnospiraceae bacterium]
MKKLLAVILFALITINMSIISLAAEDITQDSQEQSGETNVNYNIGLTYTVTIPASVTFTDSEKLVERGLQASNVFINEGTSLNVKISSRNDFKMKCGDGYIDYSILYNSNEATEGNNYTILTVGNGDTAGWVILRFTTELDKKHAKYAGNYTDTLTFTVSVD